MERRGIKEGFSSCFFHPTSTCFSSSPKEHTQKNFIPQAPLETSLGQSMCFQDVRESPLVGSGGLQAGWCEPLRSSVPGGASGRQAKSFVAFSHIFVQSVVFLREWGMLGTQATAESLCLGEFSPNISFSNWGYLLWPFCLRLSALSERYNYKQSSDLSIENPSCGFPESS